VNERFIITNMRPATYAVVKQACDIMEEYEQQGFTLTLRSLFYQFVSRNLLPNTQADYKRLGTIIADGRRGGHLDWSLLEDRTRSLRSLPTWRDPAERIASAAENYREDIWSRQPYYVEVWLEKDALLGVIEGVCDEWRVPYFSCRGGVSDSEMYNAGHRCRAAIKRGQTPVVLGMWDHDPSGLDMSRDVHDRLELFTKREVPVRRLALNFDQTTGLPPNPAKETDGCYASYARLYGDESFELDALDPTFIAELIRDEVTSLIDAPAWDAALAAEAANRDTLHAMATPTG
jgi:hypothetical protein